MFLIFTACTVCSYVTAQSAADSMLSFMQANARHLSLTIRQNGTTMAAINQEKMMPLASVVKVLVAVEFAQQAAEGTIRVSDMVPLEEINSYYLPGTDGGAHPQWYQYEKGLGHIKHDSVSLTDVARGMMMFSSNANTEYLMDLLGFDNVKNIIPQLGIKHHTPVYPLVASLFFYQNPKNLKEGKILKGIKSMSNEMYARYIYDIHKALKFSDSLKPKFRLNDLTPKMQQLWSDRLPASTSADYAHAMGVLNRREVLGDDAYPVLMDILEFVMENPNNRQWLKHAAFKGGSTAIVFTQALYATLKEGAQIEIVYFFNDLKSGEADKIGNWANSFNLALLTDAAFRTKVQNAFSPTLKN